MSTDAARGAPPRKVTCADGRRYVIFNAEILGDYTDGARWKWYFQPYPVPMGMEPGLRLGRGRRASGPRGPRSLTPTIAPSRNSSNYRILSMSGMEYRMPAWPLLPG